VHKHPKGIVFPYNNVYFLRKITKKYGNSKDFH